MVKKVFQKSKIYFYLIFFFMVLGEFAIITASVIFAINVYTTGLSGIIVVAVTLLFLAAGVFFKIIAELNLDKLKK